MLACFQSTGTCRSWSDLRNILVSGSDSSSDSSRIIRGLMLSGPAAFLILRSSEAWGLRFSYIISGIDGVTEFGADILKSVSYVKTDLNWSFKASAFLDEHL